MGENAAANVAFQEAVWLDANRFYDAESRYLEVLLVDLLKKANPGTPPKVEPSGSKSSIASELGNVVLKIQNCLKSGESLAASQTTGNIMNRMENYEKRQEAIEQKVEKLASDMNEVLSRLSSIEKILKQHENRVPEINRAPEKVDSSCNIQNGSSATAEDDDDIDLFGSDEEDDAAAKLREERLQAYANKKAKKPALVAKSSVVLDVKPWDDETDMKAMEKAVRAVQADGLVWGASKLVPLAYGISKLQIIAVVEDEKVSIDWLQETICEIEDLVQSVDIAAFNKL